MTELPPRALIGRWRLLRADPALDFAPGVEMHFQTRDRLLYSFDVGDRRESMQLGYRVSGDEIRAEYPQAAHEVTTHFRFAAGGILVLDFAGAQAWFVRELAAGA